MRGILVKDYWMNSGLKERDRSSFGENRSNPIRTIMTTTGLSSHGNKDIESAMPMASLAISSAMAEGREGWGCGGWGVGVGFDSDFI